MTQETTLKLGRTMRPNTAGYWNWDLERARIENTRDVSVELIVNGESAATGGAEQIVPPTNHPPTAKEIKQYQAAQKKAAQKADRDAKRAVKNAKAPAPPE